MGKHVQWRVGASHVIPIPLRDALFLHNISIIMIIYFTYVMGKLKENILIFSKFEPWNFVVQRTEFFLLIV